MCLIATNTSSKDRSFGTGGIPTTTTIDIRYRSHSSHGPPWRKIAAAMSTLTNNANNNNNNIINSSSGNSASIQQQQQHQFTPQGATSPTSISAGVVGSSTVATTSNSFNNNFHAFDCIHIINNNLNSTGSQSQPPTTTTSTTASNSSGSGGVVSGILGVQEFSAKLFLPFSRAKMMHSSSINATANTAADPTASGTMDSPMAAAGSSKGAAGNVFTSSNTGSSGTSRGASSSLVIPEALNVVLHGYQRKFKTNKKKYFVVYGDRPGLPARLEYFDSEKKFKQSFLKSGNGEGPTPKRSISLRSCFNINKRHDTKKHIIALYTKDDNFCILFETEDEMNRWLRTLLRLQRGEESAGDPPKPTFGT
uniref:PH domain-containing protein n=1 Tax=Anopheles minimus TaxID=112268 RepID=A0A182VU76_9DIPT